MNELSVLKLFQFSKGDSLYFYSMSTASTMWVNLEGREVRAGFPKLGHTTLPENYGHVYLVGLYCE